MKELFGAAAACAVLLGAGTASAQTSAGIAGNVKDATGAVLPGVTVEAASPALIEKTVSVVTDDKGEYKIVNLRPGVYSVTATLSGFNAYRREGVELSAGFTATVNAELKVGSVAETVTVTGASPIVDTQNSRTQQVLRGDVIEALPTGTKSLMQFAALTLGAMPSSASRQDVGGDKGELATGIILHGGRGDDGRTNWDGMNTNVSFGNSGGKERTYYFNTVGVQEVVVDTGGNSAEIETGGANINMVPKDGSNTFKFTTIDSFTNHSLSASAISSDVAARGASPQSTLKQIYDVGVGLGGPILHDKLWFYTPNRWWGSQIYGLNNYFNQSTNPYAYVPDLNRPAYTDTFFRDNAVRLTWQAAAKHKFTQEEHFQNGCSCWQTIGSGGLQSPEASSDSLYGSTPQVLSQTTWSYAATSRLLVQAGATFLRQHVSPVNGAAANHSAFTGIGTPTFPGPNNFAITEQVGVPGGAPAGYTYGALAGGTFSYAQGDDADNFNQRVSVSYITGSHAFKVGLQFFQGHYDITAMDYPGLNQVNYTFRAGIPAALTEFAGPFASKERLSSQAVYAQDQWTLSHLTVNVGVRFDRFEAHTLGFSLPAGTFVPARSVQEFDGLPDFKDITPRIGASYDVFGNGKTAIKAAFGRYLYSQGGGLSLLVAPSLAIVQSVTRTWTDANQNFVPDCTLTNPAINGECGAISNAAFGQPLTNISIANDAREGWGTREYDYQTSVQLQQEIRPGFGVAIGYFRTSWGNLTVTQNTAVSPSDFTPFCVTAPADARLGQFSAQPICGLYDVNQNKFGQVNRVITLASNFGTPSESYNGVDIGFNARWGKGALVQGGVSIGRETIDYCYANNRPDLTPENFPAALYPRDAAHCHVSSPWWDGIGSQIKLAAVYPLPWNFQVSGTYKNLPGIPDSANLVLTNAQVAPALGRNLSAGAAGTVTVPLIALGSNGDTTQGTVFDQRLNETDARLTKIFQLGRTRAQAMVDVYNVFNNRPPQGINPTYGAAFLRPTLLLGGRLLKFGMQIDF